MTLHIGERRAVSKNMIVGIFNPSVAEDGGMDVGGKKAKAVLLLRNGKWVPARVRAATLFKRWKQD